MSKKPWEIKRSQSQAPQQLNSELSQPLDMMRTQSQQPEPSLNQEMGAQMQSTSNLQPSENNQLAVANNNSNAMTSNNTPQSTAAYNTTNQYNSPYGTSGYNNYGSTYGSGYGGYGSGYGYGSSSYGGYGNYGSYGGGYGSTYGSSYGGYGNYYGRFGMNRFGENQDPNQPQGFLQNSHMFLDNFNFIVQSLSDLARNLEMNAEGLHRFWHSIISLIKRLKNFGIDSVMFFVNLFKKILNYIKNFILSKMPASVSKKFENENNLPFQMKLWNITFKLMIFVFVALLVSYPLQKYINHDKVVDKTFADAFK